MNFGNPYTGGVSVGGVFTGEISVPNPYTPYDGQIQGGLQPGKRITIRGHIRHNCQTFRVDLINHSGTIALHFNPRFHENVIVRNSEIGGWGKEERHGAFPFRRGENFELVIRPEHDHYKISVNGQHLFDYFHRTPLHEVNRLAVQGDIDCHSISFSGDQAIPEHHHRPAPHQPVPEHRPSPHHHHPHQTPPNEVYNPPVPGAIPIHGGCRPGKMIQIQGHVPHHAKRFEIDLQGGPQYLPNELSMHFNPRWDDPSQPQPVVVRNHKNNGSWGSEERNGGFPFQKGATFEMLILCEPNEWKVAVNGQHFIGYNHQNPCNVDHLYIHGDVVINYVKQFN